VSIRFTSERFACSLCSFGLSSSVDFDQQRPVAALACRPARPPGLATGKLCCLLSHTKTPEGGFFCYMYVLVLVLWRLSAADGDRTS
jgi:hypothetical protein